MSFRRARKSRSVTSLRSRTRAATARSRERTTPSIGWQPGSFAVKFNETTRAYFERAAEWEGPQAAADIRSVLAGTPDPAFPSITRLSANPVHNAQLRTTCVATMLEGGHAVKCPSADGAREGKLPNFARRVRAGCQTNTAASPGRRPNHDNADR